MTEETTRIMINDSLRDAGWILTKKDGVVNVDTEMQNDAGVADYVLKNSSDAPICVIEAKKEIIDPLVGKEQARGYATSLNCRFVILSNGFKHYFWDIEQSSPTPIHEFPSQEKLEWKQSMLNPQRDEGEKIDVDYLAKAQFPNFQDHPDYRNKKRRDEFLRKHNIRLLRDYQLRAVQAVQNGILEGRDRFLLEMATGTGKTLTSSAIIRMFLRLYGVKRVLFLVDRIELETQAQKEFDLVLKNDYKTVIWKENRSDWTKAEIVVSTVQSFISKNKYRRIFRPDHFNLVISDEAHRSLGRRSRDVFEYFIGFKLGLTATPKDYLKSLNIDDVADPRELERRLMLDTYTTFGCAGSEPTFRYSLEDGVKGGYLVNPKVMDARTRITTELLSEQGFLFTGTDEEGNDVEEIFTKKSYEKKLFSENTNRIFCETFLQHAMPDPYTGETGKTLIFCVSQKHATKIAQILNVMADKMFPGQYNSDFALQVTSIVENAQQMTTNFRNNNLNGKSGADPHYRTSRTRVCVTVGMMTTGYDCRDILNICMMRPVYSPSEFIQMKGRGTRRYDFSQAWTKKSEMPDQVEAQKERFLLFDFFGNYEYFEKDFDYDEVLKLPLTPSDRSADPALYPDRPPAPDEAIITDPDPLTVLREIQISNQGMKIDRELYPSFQKTIMGNPTIKDFVRKGDFEKAAAYLEKKVFNKPKEFYTLKKLGRALGLDRKLTVQDLLLYVFGHITHIPSKRECMDEELDRFEKKIKPGNALYDDAREVFEAYASDGEYRKIIEDKSFADLAFHPSGTAFKKLPAELREGIPAYIVENVNLERLSDVR